MTSFTAIIGILSSVITVGGGMMAIIGLLWRVARRFDNTQETIKDTAKDLRAAIRVLVQHEQRIRELERTIP